uniref:Uncharacterized protein n=1 Tax=Avena sativa TaxID=4498 RepID=A0ACD5UUZ5_AVESA
MSNCDAKTLASRHSRLLKSQTLRTERERLLARNSSISLMALSSLLLPSSSASTATDTPDRRRQQHHSKRKKKPPPSPLPSLSPAPRTPSPAPSASRRAASRRSPAPASKLVAAKNDRLRHHSKKAAPAPAKPATSSSWEQLKSLLSCRSATAASRVHDPAALTRSGGGAWGTSLCSMRDVAVDGASSAASVDHRGTAPLNRSSRRAHRAGASSSSSGGGGGHPSSLRGLSGCYECRAINVEPVSRRYPRPRELCPCPQCGEVFTKADSLEQHQAIRHAVSELGPEDSGRNIVEIIFKSSWQKRDRPICQIDRILKVHNSPRTVARFEAYRDAVRARCRAATPSSSGAAAGTTSRAAADGNELLRFHPAGLACALGAAGSASLCSSATDDGAGEGASAACGVCAAIRHGFAPWAGAHPLGVRTTASSGRAHDCGVGASAPGWRAMLVCRVIAGQVRREESGGVEQEGAPFDSVAGEVDAATSAYGTLEELFVANPRAILPCFVVIYRVDVAQ